MNLKQLKSRYTIQELEIMWNELSNVPTNFNDEIEENFYCWERGSDRFHIWHWFDDKLPNGIYEWALA